jgi:SAM-dependent methyltransferase
MTLSAASAAEQRSSSAKLEALLAKLAVRKLELDKVAAEARLTVSDSDASDDEPILSPAENALAAPDEASSSPATRGKPATRGHLPKRTTASVYGTKQYWDARYGAPNAVVGENLKKGETNNEWYVGWRVLRPYALEYAARSHRVLLLGIGTSTLGEDMASDGFSRVTAVDYSEPAVRLMRRAQQNRLGARARAATRGDSEPESLDAPTPPTPFEVDYRVMDVTRMTFADEAFDCVLDKATLDTMCQLDDDEDEDDDDEEEARDEFGDATKNKTKISRAARMLRESCRALRPGGTYVCVTYGAPSDRMDLFLDLALDWDLVAHREIPKNKIKYHLYALRRRGGAEAAKRSADVDPAAVVDVTSLEVIRVGNSTAAIPVFRDPFHGSALDMRDRPYRK